VSLANAWARSDVVGGGSSDVGVGDVSRVGTCAGEGRDRAGGGFCACARGFGHVGLGLV
jgi:hypothetical protein